jgi:hypothetical protein
MQSSFPNIILTVIPYVALDMVSYSSYDTQALNPTFGAALDFIAQHHNPTSASPSPAVYIGEYGVPQMTAPLKELQNVTANVVAWALQPGIIKGWLQKAAHVIFWELFDNEATDTPSGHCSADTGPVWDPSNLHGFWLIKPTAELSWAWGYLQGIINGSLPVPVPGR